MRERQGNLARLARLVFAYAILPNIPFLIIGRFIHVQRAVINVDYLAWGSLSIWLPWPVTLAGTVALIGTDFLESFSGIYYLNLADTVSAFTNLAHLSPFFVVSSAVLCLGAICLAATGITFIGGRYRHIPASLALIALIALLGAGDSMNGTSMLSRKQAVLVPVNLVGSPGLRASQQLLMYAQELRYPAQHVEHVQSATASLLQVSQSEEQSGENIVLVLEESLGLATDPQLNDAVLGPFKNSSISSRYKVELGTVPFHGSTVAGEFRELCGAGLGLRSREAAAGELAGCLPSRLREWGYTVEAIHGFTAQMFGRSRWYPKLGFDHFLAEEQLPGMPHCGIAFEGVCDDQLANLIRQHLEERSTGPRFIYWLTLNSHLPVDPGVAHGDTMNCDAIPELRQNSDVCDLARVLHWTNDAIARLAADPDLPPTRFIIVGDHAPPFLSGEKRAVYSQTQVPYVSLAPLRSASSPVRNPVHLAHRAYSHSREGR